MIDNDETKTAAIRAGGTAQQCWRDVPRTIRVGNNGPAPEPAQVKTLSGGGAQRRPMGLHLARNRQQGGRARSATPRRTPPGKHARTGTSPSAAS